MNNNSYYGAKNSNWKGKKVCKRAEHYRITVERGPASDYMCAMCHKQKAHDWAEQKDGSYKALCRSCHNRLDKKIRNIQDHDPRYK